jgi:hypothetical protein
MWLEAHWEVEAAAEVLCAGHFGNEYVPAAPLFTVLCSAALCRAVLRHT